MQFSLCLTDAILPKRSRAGFSVLKALWITLILVFPPITLCNFLQDGLLQPAGVKFFNAILRPVFTMGKRFCDKEKFGPRNKLPNNLCIFL